MWNFVRNQEPVWYQRFAHPCMSPLYKITQKCTYSTALWLWLFSLEMEMERRRCTLRLESRKEQRGLRQKRRGRKTSLNTGMGKWRSSTPRLHEGKLYRTTLFSNASVCSVCGDDEAKAKHVLGVERNPFPWIAQELTRTGMRNNRTCFSIPLVWNVLWSECDCAWWG